MLFGCSTSTSCSGINRALIYSRHQLIINLQRRMIVHRQKRRGRGFVNKIIDKLPVELHLPGYRYCGPGTKLAKRLARGDPGINPLDEACKEHDIAYSQNHDNDEARTVADKILADKASKRASSKDSSIGEKIAAFTVSKAMKLKSKLGMGAKRKSKKSLRLNKIVKAAAKSMIQSNNARKAILSALKGARDAVKKAGGKHKVLIPRVLPVPSKVGGFLPFLIPLFAGLSAAGAVAGGAAGIAKAVNDAKAAKLQLEETSRHNRKMEELSIGKGLYLKPHKTGMGLRIAHGKTLIKKKNVAQTKITTKTAH